MIVTLDAKRRLTIPAALAAVRPGDHLMLNSIRKRMPSFSVASP